MNRDAAGELRKHALISGFAIGTRFLNAEQANPRYTSTRSWQSEGVSNVGQGYQQGFYSMEQEVALSDLPVIGVVPHWLHGTLLRNGPAKFEAGQQQLRHWFDGLAMLHKFSFADGRVSYANKFVASPQYQAVREQDKLAYPEFATDPCRSIFKRVTTLFTPEFGHNTSVNISTIADRFVAWTETPIPIEFDPETLETLGLFHFNDQLKLMTSTPHPHAEPCTGDMLNNSVAFGKTSNYHLYRIAQGTQERQLIASLPTSEPAYMHSFAVTEHYIVLAEYPLVVSPLTMLLSGASFAENLRWKPERGTTFHVIRIADGVVIRSYQADPFFCFHHVNAFERNDEIVVDLLAYADASIVERLYLNVLRARHEDHTPVPGAELRRYHLPLQAATATFEGLVDKRIELPRINYQRCHARPYRYVYGDGLNKERPFEFLNQLVKIDVEQRTVQVWHEPGCFPGEPVFVAAPDAQAEDDGLLLSVVLDADANQSFVLLLDARGLSEVARAVVPHCIPFGFHGQFYARQ